MAKKKKKVEKAPRQFTRRQISSIKKHKRRQNIILYGGIGIIAAVIIIVLVGLYIGEIRPYRQTALEVYDRDFSVQYYIDAATYGLELNPPEYRAQIISTVVQGLPNVIQRSELIRLGAEDMGITVDDDEVKATLEESGFTVNEASIDLARIELLRKRLYDEVFGLEIPEKADQVNIMAMYLESEIQVNNIKNMLEAGDNFTALADNYSLQYYTKDVASDLGWHISDWLENWLESTVPFDYAFNAEPGTLSGPLYDENLDKNVGYWIVNVLERVGEDQAHLQAILVGNEQEAGTVLQRFIMGEDFGELAREFSQDESSRDNGGDLGMVIKGARTDAVDAYVFSAEVQDVGVVGPIPDYGVTTEGGYWLINVIDNEIDRPLGAEDKGYLENNVYSDWAEQLFEEASESIDASFLSLETINWIMEKLREDLM